MALTGSAVLIYYQYQKEQVTKQVMSQVTTTGTPALGGPFVLVNHRGEPVTDASFRGSYLLLYFGFTFCPDICTPFIYLSLFIDQQYTLARS